MQDFTIEFEGDKIEFQRSDTENFETLAPYDPSVSNTSTLCKLNTIFQEIFEVFGLKHQYCSLLSRMEEHPSIYSNTTGQPGFSTSLIIDRYLTVC